MNAAHSKTMLLLLKKAVKDFASSSSLGRYLNASTAKTSSTAAARTMRFASVMPVALKLVQLRGRPPFLKMAAYMSMASLTVADLKNTKPVSMRINVRMDWKILK